MIDVTIKHMNVLIPLDENGETFRETLAVCAYATDGETVYVEEIVVSQDEPYPELLRVYEKLAEQGARRGLQEHLASPVT